MYFITPCDPNIFLIGIDGTQIYGIGEKDGKLCIYTKSLFDVGRWKEFFTIDINVDKCECCKNGLYVAAEILNVDLLEVDGVKQKLIWIAAREYEFTHIFSITIETKEYTRYKMLHEIYPEVALLDLNLCCKCVAPAILSGTEVSNYISLIIDSRQYKHQEGIYRIYVTISQSNHCLLWKKMDSFTLDSRSSSNILINRKGEVLSVIEKSEEDRRIQAFALKLDARQIINPLPVFDGDTRKIWHEISFCICGDYLLTRRNDGDKSFLQIWYLNFSLVNILFNYNRVDYCTVDANFPTLESTHFFVSYRSMDREILEAQWQLRVLVTFIVFQAGDGNTVVIPLYPLTLSESAYLTLTRIPDPRHLPIANISIYDYIFQQIRTFFGSAASREEDDVWMSLDFIKKTLGLSNDFDLIH